MGQSVRADFETIAAQLDDLIASQVAGLTEVGPDNEKDRVQISPRELGRGDSEIAYVAVVERDQRRLGRGERKLEIVEGDGVVTAVDDRVELIAEVASGDRMFETRGLGNRSVRGDRVIHQNRKIVALVHCHPARRSPGDIGVAKIVWVGIATGR